MHKNQVDLLGSFSPEMRNWIAPLSPENEQKLVGDINRIYSICLALARTKKMNTDTIISKIDCLIQDLENSLYAENRR